MTLPAILLSLMVSGPRAAQVAGTWNLASQPDLAALVERATAGLTPAQRAIAHQRLAKHNQVFPRIVVTCADGHITVQYGDRAPQRMPDNGFAVSLVQADGEKVLVSGRLEGGGLIHTLMAEDGMRENTFRVDGGVLTLHVKIKAILLSRPLVYTLTYRR